MGDKKIYSQILRLVSYGLNTKLIKEQDVTYTINSLMELFAVSGPDEDGSLETYCGQEDSLEDILAGMLDYAVQERLIPENTVVCRDLFDTRIMGKLVKRPSEVIAEFWENYKVSPEAATGFYYKMSQDSDYIRRYRVKKDIKWLTSTEYGDLDITINLSKPEKDPRSIAAARNMKQTSYPLCLLCRENEGYAGRIDHPARQNHRVIPVTLNQEGWYMQYSPYVYYNEHCIVFRDSHTPMVINEATFRKLIDFVNLFPHYVVGSNADLPIVGGSILTHEHFQGGNYRFAMMKAPAETAFRVKGFETVEASIVKWPMSVICLSGEDDEQILALAGHILETWKNYSDEECFIYSNTDGERHNTITPIAYKQEKKTVLDLVLRNNITTEEHPLGVFHPHSRLHHIKKENIGLIEVMGLAVLPARLNDELQEIKKAILKGDDLRANETIAKHADWVDEIRAGYDELTEENLENILKHETGKVFLQVLEDAGVYKRNEEGKKGFLRFVEALNSSERRENEYKNGR